MSAVPPYPVIHVTVAGDGSAHANVAGRHKDFPAADLTDTRQTVIGYAATIAADLRRPVRMKIVDPDGEWNVAVDPAGVVVEDPHVGARRNRPRKAPTTAATPTDQIPRGRGTLPPPPVPQPAAWAVPEPEDEYDDPDPHTRLSMRRRTVVPTARLHASTGESATFTVTALVGRRPAADPGEVVELLFTINDDTRQVSRTHLRLEWEEGVLWATDRAAGNGTLIERAGAVAVELTPWNPYRVQNGDVAVLGDVRLAITFSDAESGNLA
jgi:hypothetical protein